MKLTIDDTTRSGNFFDKINNQSYIVKEYYVWEDNFKDILKEIKPDSYVKFEMDNINDNFNNTSSKYDFIDENNLVEYQTDSLEHTYEIHQTIFNLTKYQYKRYLAFIDKHHDCLVDSKTYKPKFGAIGGGISIIYKTTDKFNIEILDKFVKCYGCNDIEQLIDEDIDFNISDEELEIKYQNYCKYPNKLNKVEFYRFNEIYEEYVENKKEQLEIGFIGTGLGHLVNVKTKDFSYDITDTNNW